MADPDWVYVERIGGRVRRVALLDHDLQVISTQARDLPGEDDGAAVEGQLLRAVELERRVGLVG